MSWPQNAAVRLFVDRATAAFDNSLYYLAEVVGGQEQPGEEATGLGWFTWDALPARLAARSLPAALEAARSTLPRQERSAQSTVPPRTTRKSPPASAG